MFIDNKTAHLKKDHPESNKWKSKKSKPKHLVSDLAPELNAGSLIDNKTAEIKVSSKAKNKWASKRPKDPGTLRLTYREQPGYRERRKTLKNMRIDNCFAARVISGGFIANKVSHSIFNEALIKIKIPLIPSHWQRSHSIR